jgi:hypothetical protein
MQAETPAPEPPPEAIALRLAREATGLNAGEAAAATGGAVGAPYWRDVERGHGGRRGKRVRVRASDKALAHMARTVGLSPQSLVGADRAGAARVLEEILRRESPASTVVPTSRVGEEVSDPERWLWSEVLRLTKKHGRNPLGTEIFPPDDDNEEESQRAVWRETWDDAHGDMPDDAARIRLVARLMRRACQVRRPETQGHTEAGLCRT